MRYNFETRQRPQPNKKPQETRNESNQLQQLKRGVGQYIPRYASKYGQPLASDWADKTKLTARWDYFSTPKPGDIGSYRANYSNATGHTGFVITEGVTISFS